MGDAGQPRPRSERTGNSAADAKRRRLRHLSTLHANGELTKEEFEQLRRRLLAKNRHAEGVPTRTEDSGPTTDLAYGVAKVTLAICVVLVPIAAIGVLGKLAGPSSQSDTNASNYSPASSHMTSPTAQSLPTVRYTIPTYPSYTLPPYSSYTIPTYPYYAGVPDNSSSGDVDGVRQPGIGGTGIPDDHGHCHGADGKFTSC